MPRIVAMGRRQSWRDKFEARGRALVGHLLTNPTIIYDPMATEANWLRAGTQAPTLDKTPATQGGGFLLNTTGASGQNSDLYYNAQAGATRTSLLSRPSTVPWYQAWRASIDVLPGVDAATQMSGGLCDVTVGAFELLGVRGAVSTAKFAYQSAANNTLSAVDIALGIFEFEIWGIGSTAVRFRVNGEDPKTVTYGNGAVDSWQPFFGTANGASALQRAWRVLDMLIMTNGT